MRALTNAKRRLLLVKCEADDMSYFVGGEVFGGEVVGGEVVGGEVAGGSSLDSSKIKDLIAASVLNLASSAPVALAEVHNETTIL